MLKGRLGISPAKVPHSDRHGCIWLRRGILSVEDGTIKFTTSGSDNLRSGVYAIPFQTVSMIFLEPGCSVTHDALRILAAHDTGLVVIGEDGVRLYASLYSGRDESRLARLQTLAWADREMRLGIARKMYAIRMGDILPSKDITVLRGIEGARQRSLYAGLAKQYGLSWHGRRCDRNSPEIADPINQAINHVSAAIKAAAMIAVASTSTIPQLGFIHEDSRDSFCLDIADLFRDNICVPTAFRAAKHWLREPAAVPLEKICRRYVAETLRSEQVIPLMIDKIKNLFLEE